jgi:hypothetical protein
MEERKSPCPPSGFQYEGTLSGPPRSHDCHMLSGLYVFGEAALEFRTRTEEFVADRAAVFKWAHLSLLMITVVLFCIVHFCIVLFCTTQVVYHATSAFVNNPF